jgi:hypothetical protein
VHQYYWAFTQLPTFLNFGEPPKGIKPLLASITTDLVVDSSLCSAILLKPLADCLKYFIAIPPQTVLLEQLAMTVLHLCPNEALFVLQGNLDVSVSYDEITRIIRQREVWSTISLALNVLRKENIENEQDLLTELQQMIDSKGIQKANPAESVFELLFVINAAQARICLPQLIANLPPLELICPLVSIADEELADDIRSKNPFF